MNEKGVAEFARYVAGAPESLFYVLADVVEEDFFQENIPYVRGADRRALLARKLAPRYPAASPPPPRAPPTPPSPCRSRSVPRPTRAGAKNGFSTCRLPTRINSSRGWRPCARTMPVWSACFRWRPWRPRPASVSVSKVGDT